MLALLAVAVLTGCSPSTPAPLQPPPRAMRIVSLDYCADQFVLQFADREHILALSPDAAASFSYQRDEAAGIATVRPRAEDVLLLAPDLVVRSYGGGPNVHALLQRAGVPLLQIGFASTLDDVEGIVRDVSAALGVPARGERLLEDMRRRLAALHTAGPELDALYLTPSGFTAGPGTLVAQMLEAAGLGNFQVDPGWRPVPLERLAYEGPELVASARFGDEASQDRARTPLRHPVARRRLGATPEVVVDGATTTCGGWFLVDAVEVLAAARRVGR